LELRKTPPGALMLVQREVGPGASGTITDYFTTGSSYAVECLDQHGSPEQLYAYAPFALVGPIVVP
jgi:hypothetical protein